MNLTTSLAKKYRVIAEKIECPKCHKDLTEQSSVVRTDDRGGDEYAYGHYDMKFGDFTVDEHGRHRDHNYVDFCSNCDTQLAAG